MISRTVSPTRMLTLPLHLLLLRLHQEAPPLLLLPPRRRRPIVMRTDQTQTWVWVCSTKRRKLVLLCSSCDIDFVVNCTKTRNQEASTPIITREMHLPPILINYSLEISDPYRRRASGSLLAISLLFSMSLFLLTPHQCHICGQYP